MVFIFCVLFQISLALINHDTGYFTDFDYNLQADANVCRNGYKKTSTITFSDQFANPPQIILTMEKTDENNDQPEVVFNILTVTTSSFQLYQSCLSSVQIFAFRFRWFAIDDLRIQVINQFNVSNFDNYTIPHTNPNFQNGFISVLGFGYSGPINFYIKISQITQSNVSIQINNPNNQLVNIKRLHYQIILATPESIQLIATFNLTSSFTSSNIPVVPNTFFLIATQGCIYTKEDNIRLLVTYTSQDPIAYSLANWYHPYFTQVMNSQIQLSYSFTLYLLLKCDNIRVSQRNDLNTVTQPSIVFNIETINLSYSTVGTFTQIIDKQLSSIKLEIQVRCKFGKKITSQFYMYPENIGQKQMKTLQHYCFNESNLKVFYPRFTQQMIAYEKITISITNTGCQMFQVLYNQVKTTNTLLDLQIV